MTGTSAARREKQTHTHKRELIRVHLPRLSSSTLSLDLDLNLDLHLDLELALNLRLNLKLNLNLNLHLYGLCILNRSC